MPTTNLTYFNRPFDKARLKLLLKWTLLSFGENKTINLVETLKNVGYSSATQAGISLSIDDLDIPLKKGHLLVAADTKLEQTSRQVLKGYLTSVEYLTQVIDTWNQTNELIKDEVIQNFRLKDVLNPVYMMAFSGARGNISQVRQLVGMRGLMADPSGRIIDFPIQSNFREGLTLTEYIISCYGARKGVVDTALRTATSGYLTRRLIDVAQHVTIRTYDCGTKKGIYLSSLIENKKTVFDLKSRLIGRVLAENIEHPTKPKLIGKRNEEITNRLAKNLLKHKTNILVRSALTCLDKTSVCQLCYGWSLATNRLVTLGETVGIIAAQSIGEPGTQLTMRTFHTGGVFSGEVSESLKSPVFGQIYFPKSIAGKCVRTTHGEIAFLTKQPGVLFIDETANLADANKTAPLAFTLKKENKLHHMSIKPYTLLFVKQGQTVSPNQILAETSSLSKLSQKSNSFQTIYSNLSGEIRFRNSSVIQNFHYPPYTNNAQLSSSIGEFWVLSAQTKKFFKPIKSFVQKGDFIQFKSVLFFYYLFMDPRLNHGPLKSIPFQQYLTFYRDRTFFHFFNSRIFSKQRNHPIADPFRQTNKPFLSLKGATQTKNRFDLVFKDFNHKRQGKLMHRILFFVSSTPKSCDSLKNKKKKPKKNTLKKSAYHPIRPNKDWSILKKKSGTKTKKHLQTMNQPMDFVYPFDIKEPTLLSKVLLKQKPYGNFYSTKGKRGMHLKTPGVISRKQDFSSVLIMYDYFNLIEKKLLLIISLTFIDSLNTSSTLDQPNQTRKILSGFLKNMLWYFSSLSKTETQNQKTNLFNYSTSIRCLDIQHRAKKIVNKEKLTSFSESSTYYLTGVPLNPRLSSLISSRFRYCPRYVNKVLLTNIIEPFKKKEKLETKKSLSIREQTAYFPIFKTFRETINSSLQQRTLLMDAKAYSMIQFQKRSYYNPKIISVEKKAHITSLKRLVHFTSSDYWMPNYEFFGRATFIPYLNKGPKKRVNVSQDLLHLPFCFDKNPKKQKLRHTERFTPNPLNHSQRFLTNPNSIFPNAGHNYFSPLTYGHKIYRNVCLKQTTPNRSGPHVKQATLTNGLGQSFYLDQTFLLFSLLKQKQTVHSFGQVDTFQTHFSFYYVLFNMFLTKIDRWKETMVQLKNLEKLYGLEKWLGEAEKRARLSSHTTNKNLQQRSTVVNVSLATFAYSNAKGERKAKLRSQKQQTKEIGINPSIFSFINKQKVKQVNIRSFYQSDLQKNLTPVKLIKNKTPSNKKSRTRSRLQMLRYIKIKTHQALQKKPVSMSFLHVYFNKVTLLKTNTTLLFDFPFSFLYSFGACLSPFLMVTDYYKHWDYTPSVFKRSVKIHKRFYWNKLKTEFRVRIHKKYYQIIKQNPKNRYTKRKQEQIQSVKSSTLVNFQQRWLELNKPVLINNSVKTIPWVIYKVFSHQKGMRFKTFVQKIHEDTLLFYFYQSKRAISDFSLIFLCNPFFDIFGYLTTNYTLAELIRSQSFLISMHLLKSPFLYKKNQGGLLQQKGKKRKVFRVRQEPFMEQTKIDFYKTFKIVKQQRFFVGLTSVAQKKLDKLKWLKKKSIQDPLNQTLLLKTPICQPHSWAAPFDLTEKSQKAVPFPLLLKKQQEKNESLFKKTAQVLKSRQKKLATSGWVFLTFNPNLSHMTKMQRPGNRSKNALTHFSTFTTFQTFFSAPLLNLSPCYDAWLTKFDVCKKVQQNQLFSIHGSSSTLTEVENVSWRLKPFLKHSHPFLNNYLERYFFEGLLFSDGEITNLSNAKKSFSQLLKFYAQSVKLDIKAPRSLELLATHEKNDCNLININTYVRLVFFKQAKLPFIFRNIKNGHQHIIYKPCHDNLQMIHPKNIYFSPCSRYLPTLTVESIKTNPQHSIQTINGQEKSSLMFRSKTNYLFSMIQKISLFSTNDLTMSKMIKSDPKLKNLRTEKSTVRYSETSTFDWAHRLSCQNTKKVELPFLKHHLISSTTFLSLPKPKPWPNFLTQFKKNQQFTSQFTTRHEIIKNYLAIRPGKCSEVFIHHCLKGNSSSLIRPFFKDNSNLLLFDFLPTFGLSKKVKNASLFKVNPLDMGKNNSIDPEFSGFSTNQPILNSKKELSPMQGEILNLSSVETTKNSSIPKIDRLKYKKQNLIEVSYLTDADMVTYRCPKHFSQINQPWKKSIGAFVPYGETVRPGQVLSHPGQIIYLTKDQIMLRHAQCFLLSSGSICHWNQGDHVSNGSPLLNVSYSNVQTEDIIQGIPKIDQLFEAKNRRGFVNLNTLLQNYYVELIFLGSRRNAVIQSFSYIQKYIIDSIQNVYQSQGVNISDKHVEIIVKQMTAKVRILNGSDTGLLRGDVISFNTIEISNVEALDDKLEYEPVLLGITQASLQVNGFISAASFQETVRVLTQATVLRKTDFLKGLKENIIIGHLLPAGTGYNFPSGLLKKPF